MVRHNIFSSLKFTKIAPISASAAQEVTDFKKEQSVWMAPLIFMGLLSSEVYPRKNYPAARLRPCVSDRYDTS